MVTLPQGLCQGLLCASERGGAAVLGLTPRTPCTPPHPAPPHPAPPRSGGLETRWPEAAPGPAAWGCGHGSATGGQAHSPPCRGAHTQPCLSCRRGLRPLLGLLGESALRPRAPKTAVSMATAPQHATWVLVGSLPAGPRAAGPAGSAGSVPSGFREEDVGRSLPITWVRVLLSEPVVNISRIF